MQTFDYTSVGGCFVTLCVEKRASLLGTIRKGEIVLSPAGQMVDRVWGGLGSYYPGVTIVAFVVMPNHVHGIVLLSAGDTRGSLAGNTTRGGATKTDRDGAAVPTPVEFDERISARRASEGVFASSGAPRAEHRAATPLPVLIQRFKTFTAHEYGIGVAKEDWPRYPGRLWQHRFYEHIIRNQHELDAIREYIANNPLQWHLDRENPEYQPAKK